MGRVPRYIRWQRAVCWLATLAAAFAGCGVEPVLLPPSSCLPGAQLACACPGGSAGVQVCDANRVLGPCACGDAATADAAPFDDRPVAQDVASDDGAREDVGARDVVAVDVGLRDSGAIDAGDPERDAGVIDAGVPERDAGSLDAGIPDVGSAGRDVGTVDVGVDAGSPDAGVADAGHDSGPSDVGAADAGTCASDLTACGGACVDLQHDARHCGGCGRACEVGSPCLAGSCFTAVCRTNASDCNGDPADRCEVVHADPLNACPSANDLGSYCGDSSCGFLCPPRSLRTVATRTGTRTAWYRGRMNECSSCTAALDTQLVLRVPTGVDFDLVVYSACGVLVGRSNLGAGETERFTVTTPRTSSSNSTDFFVEVRWISGTSCAPWTLTYEARSTSGSSC